MPARIGVQFGRPEDGLRVPGGRRAAGRAVRTAVHAALAAKGCRDAEVSVTFLDDAGIAALHRQYLGHDAPTDVLSFPLFEPGEPVVGDVYIGIEQAARQAAALAVPFREEVARLAVHGTLHVLGMDHPVGARRRTSAMWRLQERIVERLRPEVT